MSKNKKSKKESYTKNLLEHFQKNPGVWFHKKELQGEKIAGERVAARVKDLKYRGYNIESRRVSGGYAEYKFILEN